MIETGEGVTRFSVGDRVVVNPLIYCGKCPYCRRGQHIMCTKLGTVGFAADGAFAEYGVFFEYALLKLPDTVTDDRGAFVEPLAVAVHAVNRSRMQIGDSVVVVGAGPIGLLVMQACLVAGASRVFVVEPMKARRDIAQKTGAATVIDPTEADPGKAVGSLTDGLRADRAFDCVGNQASFNTAVQVTGRRAYAFFRLWGHEKEITFSSGYENEFPAAIAYLADGRVRVEPLISDRIPLDDMVEKGMRLLTQEGEKHIKILVYP